MARKNYPFNKRTDKQMNNLTSGLLTGLLIAPIAAFGALSKSSGNNVTDKKENKKNEALSSFFLVLLFITPLYAFFTYFGFKIELFSLLIIGDMLLVGSTFLFLCLWWVAISELIKAFKKDKKDNKKQEIPPTE